MSQSIFTFPWNKSTSITPSDTDNITPPAGVSPLRRCCDGIYVGGAGDIVWVQEDGTTQLLKAVPVGTMLPIRAKRIDSTNTTASNLVALYEA